MNSIQDLNNYANSGIAFTDPNAVFSIAFSNATPVNQSISVLENQSFLAPTGTDITTLTGANLVTYTVNVSSVSGATVSWPIPLPSRAVVTNFGNGVYQLGNISAASVWNTVKNPQVNLPSHDRTNFSMVSSIGWVGSGGPSSKSWSTAVTIIPISQLPMTVADFNYPVFTSNVIPNAPQISNPTFGNAATETYTLTVTANVTYIIDNLSSTSSFGGSSNFSSISDTLTVVGNLTTINDHLNHITFTPTGLDYPGQLVYQLTNPAISWVSTCTQKLIPQTASYAFTTPSGFLYQSNSPTAITNTPQVTAGSYYDNDTITVELIPGNFAAVQSLSSTYQFGTTTTPSPVGITITGNLSTINARLANIQFSATAADDFGMTYIMTPGGVYQQAVTQTMSSLDNYITTQPSTNYYVNNTTFTVVNEPLIRNNLSDSYAVYISPSDTNAVSTISVDLTGISGDTASFNSSTKTLTVSGSGAGINSALTHLSILTGTDYIYNYTLNYSFHISSGTYVGHIVNRSQQINFSSYNAITTNLNVNRGYVSNLVTEELIFGNNTPQIVEVIYGNPTYTITISTTSGLWGFDRYNLANPFTITGTASTINSEMANLKFYPTKNYYNANDVIHYVQTRAGATQFNCNIGFVGLAPYYNSYTQVIDSGGAYWFDTNGTGHADTSGSVFGSTMYEPTYGMLNYYSYVNIAVIGGGGNGGGYDNNLTAGGLGGGVTTRVNLPTSALSSNAMLNTTLTLSDGAHPISMVIGGSNHGSSFGNILAGGGNPGVTGYIDYPASSAAGHTIYNSAPRGAPGTAFTWTGYTGPRSPYYSLGTSPQYGAGGGGFDRRISLYGQPGGLDGGGNGGSQSGGIYIGTTDGSYYGAGGGGGGGGEPGAGCPGAIILYYHN